MTTSSLKNYNIEALRGGELTDQDVVETMGLDPTLANTPEISSAMLDIIEKENAASWEPKMGAEKAAQTAKSARMTTQRTIDRLIKDM